MLLNEDLKGAWVQTYTGKHFYFLCPSPDQIDIKDIAAALSKQCRFAGHIQKFMSVAEHSVNVSYMTLNPLEGLLHDASEAYLVDMPSPVKRELSQYRDLENILMTAIASKFGFSWPLSEDTHDADNAQLIEEASRLLKHCDWLDAYRTSKRSHGIIPQCLSPEKAEELFLQRFQQLKGYS